MRVAQVCPYSLTTPGGVQGQVLGLARALRTLGHEARVLGPCDGAPPEPGVTPLGPSVPFVANGSVAPIAPGPAVARRALAAVADEGFDVIHLHEPLVPGPTLALLVAHRAPTVGTFHRAGRSRAYELLRPLVRRLAGRLDVRCAVSPDAAATATGALGGEYRVLFNGIDLERFAKARPYPTTGPTVLFLGRHEARKGLAHLLEAARTLPSDTRVWVAGTGPERASLQRRFADLPGVEWLGPIGEAEKAARLRGAHVVCAPSLWGESFGVVLLEAMAAGCAVVASDLPAYRAVVRQGVDGLLVPPADVAALAGALRRLLEDPDLVERFGAAGEARAQEFSMDRLAERYLALYEDLVGA